MPFNIPSSWKWVTLPQIACTELGKTLNKSMDKGKLTKYLCSINVYWDKIDLSNVKSTYFSDDEIKKYTLQRGDLLMCEGGDTGRCFVWDNDENMCYQNALHRIRFFANVNPIFFKYLFFLYKQCGILDDSSKGMTIQHLTQTQLYRLYIPLPPIEEQRRIVDKLETILPLIEDI